jgi:polysaccharide pyruvyl transferase WcaK-like protein
MRVGLLTFHTSNNYGALLQTYATLSVLKEAGVQTEIINLRRRPKNLLLTIVYNNWLNLSFARFRDLYLQPQSEQFYAGDDLKQLNDRYDAFIVGSDQVWRTRFTGALATNYFLDFVADDKRKISFASSFGISTWSETPELTPRIRSLLQRFDAVSVREDSGVQICREHFAVDATHVIDPSLLTDANAYSRVAQSSKLKLPKRFAAVFLLDGYSGSFESALRDSVSRLFSMPMVSLSIPKIDLPKVSFDVNPRPVCDWLKVLANCEFVVTESFHCVAFAIIFRRKFVCVVNPLRGKARLESLLKMVGLEHLLLTREDCTAEKLTELMQLEIDYDDVAARLELHKEASLAFLKQALQSS